MNWRNGIRDGWWLRRNAGDSNSVFFSFLGISGVEK